MALQWLVSCVMSCCDNLYPENPWRRYQAEHLYQQLHKGTLPNVHTTKVFMDCMTNLYRQLRVAQCLSDNDELTQTCVKLLGHMAEIQQHLPMVDGLLKQRLTARSYQSLQGFNEPSKEDALKLRSALVAILWVMVFLVMAISVPLHHCYYITTFVFDLPLQFINLVFASLVTVFCTVCLGFGADVLLSTALGALEEHQLQETIKQYERALFEIQPRQ